MISIGWGHCANHKFSAYWQGIKLLLSGTHRYKNYFLMHKLEASGWPLAYLWGTNMGNLRLAICIGCRKESHTRFGSKSIWLVSEWWIKHPPVLWCFCGKRKAAQWRKKYNFMGLLIGLGGVHALLNHLKGLCDSAKSKRSSQMFSSMPSLMERGYRIPGRFWNYIKEFTNPLSQNPQKNASYEVDIMAWIENNAGERVWKLAWWMP